MIPLLLLQDTSQKSCATEMPPLSTTAIFKASVFAFGMNMWRRLFHTQVPLNGPTSINVEDFGYFKRLAFQHLLKPNLPLLHNHRLPWPNHFLLLLFNNIQHWSKFKVLLPNVKWKVWQRDISMLSLRKNKSWGWGRMEVFIYVRSMPR